mgnify:CR=1 FL=1
MPLILEKYGYKFSFYSNENKEPPHIHIKKGGGNAKYWLSPIVREDYSYGYTIRERRDIRNLVNQNLTLLLHKWYENFK